MMDDKEKKCGLSCWSRSGIVGAIFIVLATLLTVLTLNGLGILGMFLVGCMLCHRKSHCGCSCHFRCDDSSCETKCDSEVMPQSTVTHTNVKKDML